MTCAEQTAVDAHFAGTITPDDERRMREHVALCDPCRARYRRQLLLAKLDPERSARAPEERIARGLGLGAATSPRRRFAAALPALAATFALAAVLLLVLRHPSRDGRDEGFTARGGALQVSAITVYRVGSDGGLALTDRTLGARDELAFSYDNRASKSYVMIYGVDEQRRVYWFYPAWTNEAENPTAVAIEPGFHELREAIRHPLAGGRLEIHGLFLENTASVRDVEADIRAGRVPDGEDHVTIFEVTP